MDDDFLPDELVLDDTPENDDASKVVFAGPSDAPPVFQIPRSTASLTAAHRPPYALLTFCLLTGAVILGVTASLRAPAVRPMAPAETSASPASMNAAAPATTTVIDPAAGASRPAPGAPDVQPESAEAPPAPPPDEDAAQDAKRLAQSELEKGHTAKAIEAGTRSVTLDPTDAEAWLILGAGYDQRGAYGEARRCFASCVRAATRGPRGECAALLR
jgi:tetratricopeptide (TPR) repeat protein